LGDMCAYGDGARQRLVDTYMVQRQWSNASAAAGHDPCVPALATPYVNASTHLPSITVTVQGQQFQTRAVTVPIGSPQTVDVDMYSDAPTTDWQVSAYDVASTYRGGSPELSFQFDKNTGNNGDKLHLTITRLTAGAGGYSELELVSKVNGVTI